MTTQTQPTAVPNGSAAAALLAGGIGAIAIGLMTVLAEVSQGLRTALMFYRPSGPLSGKTTVGVIIWLIAWAILDRRWRRREVDFGRAAMWAFILLSLGLLGTFPPFFLLFAGE